jgi:acetyltransferase-like isoleucine patch superfamily enzyme
MQMLVRLKTFLDAPYHEKLNGLRRAAVRLKGKLYYRRIMGSFGAGTLLYGPCYLGNARYIHIGKNVSIRPGARIEGAVVNDCDPPELRIGNNVNIEQDVHIGFMGKVRIADNVTIATRCSILAGTHPFFDMHSPVKIGQRNAGGRCVIEIGEGSLIGVGTVILMNVRIGKHVVIGANSVVKRSIPDYSVAEGNPAVVVMKYDLANDAWSNLRPKTAGRKVPKDIPTEDRSVLDGIESA